MRNCCDFQRKKANGVLHREKGSLSNSVKGGKFTLKVLITLRSHLLREARPFYLLSL